MKKHLLMLLVAVMAAVMSLEARVIVINEGFENGIQDSVWTQEYIPADMPMPWAVEDVDDGLSYPSTVVQGSKRAYLRNNKGETIGYKTRLVSKVMDLRPTKVYMPELTFWYANPKWGADRDTLRVLYRTGSYAAWKQMAEFSTASSDWQYVKLSLPEVGQTYQIAFEGKDNLGRGIVLDSIKLQSAPECTTPHDLIATNKGAGKVNISWTASWDADFYELLVTKDTIVPDLIDEIEATTPEKIVYHDLVNGVTNKDLVLEAGEFYLAYVRSLCEGENSSWSSEQDKEEPFGFKVRTVKQVPFTETFNYKSGVLRDVDWTWGSNTQNTNPFVNSKASATAWAYYSQDVTPAVIFSGGETSKPETMIAANRFVYLATPALADTANDEFRVNQLQVHFWSTVYTYTGRQYGRSILVGVMDDPEDITTFVPVDTVSVWGNKTFQENIVDLGSYEGNGSYVAFVSDFDRPNVFYLDNLTIEYRKDVNKVTKITVNPRDTYATISWEGNAASYNVLVTNAEVDPSNPAASAIVDQATVTTNSYLCQALEADHSWNRPYYVYVQAAGTEWSYRYPFVTIASQRAIPYNFDFEAGTTSKYQIAGMSGQFAAGLGVFGNNGTTYPAVLTDSKYSYSGIGSLFMSKRGGADVWVTLPPVENLDEVQVKFYLSGYNTYNQAHATIGVMSNPMDINTFVPVSSFMLNTTGYTRCYANFVNYSGPDGVIAIVWDDVMKMSQNTINYIDEIIVEELSDCVPPTNVSLDILPDSITVTWESSSWDKWEFFLSRSALSETDRVHKTLEDIQAMRGVVVADSLEWFNPAAAPTFGFGGLTPHATYYLYVRSTCDMDWWSEMSFSTPCREEEYPYKENFENYNIDATTAGCWQLADYMGVGYPRIYNDGTSGSPEKTLELYSSGTIHRSVAILPQVEGNLSDMLLTFDVRTYAGTASSSAVIYVGSMEDIENSNTFVPFDTVFVDGADFKKVRFVLADYELAYDNIAITSGLGNLLMSSDVIIDNVELKDPSCIEAYDLKQSGFAAHSIDLTWNGTSDSDLWEVKVLSSNVGINAIKNNSYNAAYDVLRDSIVTGKAFHLENLQASSTYYVYVRTLCGDSTWISTPVTTSCEMLDPTKSNKETFAAYADGAHPNCWTLGTRTGTGTLPYVHAVNSQMALYIYQSSTSAPAWAASPEIKCDSLESIVVTFSMSAYNGEVCVWGVMTDPTDLNTFVPLDSMAGTGTSTFYEKRVDLSDYAALIPPTAKHVAWRARYNKSDWVYIDDISFISNACPLPKPSCSEMTTSSVRISSGLRTNSDWVLLVTNEAISETDLETEGYVVPESKLVYLDTLNSRSQVIRGLEGQTKYYVYAVTLCDSVTSSQWASINFTTPCQAMTPEAMGTITFSDKAGYETGSGGEMPCWTVGSKTQGASTTYIPYVNNSSTYKHNGNNYLQLYDNSTSSSSNVGAYAIMPELNVDSINKYQVTFWGRSNTSTSANNQVIVGVITDPSDMSTFVPVDTLNLSKSAWDPYSVGFEHYEGDYMGEFGRNIMFLSDFGTTNYAYISEISVELIPHCRSIQSFTVDSVGEKEAVVSWKGYQDTYRVMVADKWLTDEQKPKYHYLIDSVVDHSEGIRLTSLNAATTYYVYAQGVCGNDDSTAISVTYATFKTECPSEDGVPLPFYEDFESYSTGTGSPGCWVFRASSGTSYPKLSTVSGMDTKAVELYTTSSNNSWMITPVLDGDLQDMVLSFDARAWSSSYTGTLYVGTMADPNDPSTFELITSYPLNDASSFVRYTINLGDYELPYNNLTFTSGFYSAMGFTNSSDVYIDNISLELSATCNAPKLKLIGTSYESADLTLKPSKAEDALWELAIIPEADYENIGDINSYLNTLPKMTVDSTHVVFSGLTPATSYFVYARTVCGVGEVSLWTRTPLKISTKYFYEDTYFFGFEKTELYENSKYSQSGNFYIHPALEADRDSLGTESQSYMYYPYSRQDNDTVRYARTGDGALVLHAYKNYHGAYVIFPAINQPKARSFEFKIRPGDITKPSGTSSWLPRYSENGLLEIGLVDKDRGFETYERIANVRLDKLANGAATNKNNYLYKYYNLDLDSATVATKQVVFHMPKQDADSVYLYIDDVQMGAAKGYSLVSLKKIVADGTTALVEWDHVGGPWDLTIKNAAGVTVAQYNHLATTSQLVTGLVPRSEYSATLTTAVATSGSYVKTDKLVFHTICETMEPNANGTDFVWNFDDAAEWEANDVLAGGSSDSLYYKPACFHTGITYDEPVNGYQWLVQRKGYEYTGAMTGYNASRHFEVGRNNSHALRVNTTEANYSSYIVLPELNCGFDTMMIEFYGRCFANYDQTYSSASSRGRIVDATYLNSTYSQSLVIGTLTDPTDFSSLQIVDTVTYTQTDLTISDNVNDDPAGLRYWEQMRVPLEHAQGKYIVLFQTAPGLFFIDDLAVKPVGNTLFAPTGTRTSDVTTTTATMSWNTHHPELTTVIVLLDAEGTEISRTQATGTSYQMTGLDPAMRYMWYAYQTDGTNESPATRALTFATECVVVTPAYTCGFEPAEGWMNIEGQKNYTQTLCWTYGDAAQDGWMNANYDPYNQPNTKDFKYSYDGSNAVMMRATTSSRLTYQPYIAMPAMDIRSYDTLQVMFWMRPAYVSASTDSVLMSYTGSTYSKSVIVGTMTDPTNPATFVAIDTVTYDGTLSTANHATAANDYLFQQMKVELAGATGPYVAFMTSFQEKGSRTQKTGDYIWIDNVSFEHSQECKDPTELTTLQIGTYHAVLTWNGIDSAGTYLVQVSTDPFFEKEDDFVFNEEVESNTCTVKNLQPLTSYVWRVQALCGERWGESSFSQKASFKTSRSPYFLEEFSTTVSSNEWIFSKAHADNVVDTTGTLAKGVDNWSFSRKADNNGLQGPHYAAIGYNADYHWMVTPDFYLPEDDSVHFSMDLALTACNAAHLITSNAVTENDMKDDYYFMIILSDDGGQTWKSENILAKWQNTNPEGMQLRDIPATGMRVRYSLAAYAGKNVRIGLYREARSTSTTGIAIHVDNVRLAYFDKTVEQASVCQYEDLTIGEIHLSGDDTQPGIHAYPTSFYVTDAEARAGKRDSVQQLEIEVYPAQETFFTDTICEGEQYTNYGFLPKEQSGVYRRKLHTMVHGCDSVVTLTLYVKERRFAPDEQVAICRGESYVWNGKTYNRAGLFQDTLVSSIGCDSIETLVVSYVDSQEDTIYVENRVELSELPYTYINPEHPYVADQAPIFYAIGTPKGVYMDVVKVQGTECPATLVHTLTIYDAHEDIDLISVDGKAAHKVIVNDVLYIILNGEWYNAAGQKVADPRK